MSTFRRSSGRLLPNLVKYGEVLGVVGADVAADAVGSADGPLEVARVSATVLCDSPELVAGGDRV